MPTPDSFPLFGALPAELRLKIWSEALSARSVWAMAHVGPAPYLPGLACRESRKLLEESYGKPLRGPGPATGSGVYWVDPEKTVVYLGDGPNAMEVLDAFGAEERSRFRHVALRWCQFGTHGRTRRRLPTACPALRTIIIQTGDPSVREALSPRLAAYYATIPDSVNLRAIPLEGFGDSPPRTYLVTAGAADFSE